jgi:hypothetical protein
MEPKEFNKLLNQAEKLINQEKYVDALNLLHELKEVELRGDFDTSLTHRLYLLTSNAESLVNQKKIIQVVLDLARDHKEIDFNSLCSLINQTMDVNFEPAILKREIEFLILRNKIPYKIEGNKLVLS